MADREGCLEWDEAEALVADASSASDHARRHVVECEDCANDVAALAGGSRPLSARAPAPGVVPGHVLGDEIARGGQGVVYRATQLATRRTVAVKVMPLGAGVASTSRRRFEREIELASTLRHPGIVVVHDGGVTASACWIAMELVDGDDIVTHVRDGGLAPRATVELFLQVCDAIQHAHQRGVIHRDLKPANVLALDDGSVRVLDFGLARVVGATADATVTREGVFVGTFTHASPEQIVGDPALLDTRTDVYSLGVLLFQMLTNELPVVLDGSLEESLAAIRTRPPRALRSLRPTLSKDLETIVAKAVSKEPERRYATVDALAADLRRHIRGEPIDARRDSRWYLLSVAARRYRAAIAVAAAFILLLVVALVNVVMQRDVAREERLNAQREAERARIEATSAERISQVMANLLDIPPELAGMPEKLRVVDLFDVARANALPSLAADPVVQARLTVALAQGYLTLGRYADADELTSRAVPGEAEPLTRLNWSRVRSRIERGRGDMPTAVEHGRRALYLARAHDATLPPDVLPRCLLNLALTVMDLTGAGYAEARALLDEADRVIADRLPRDLLLRANALERRADLAWRSTLFDEVRARLAEARALYDEHHGGPNPPSGRNLSIGALSFVNEKRFAEAEAMARESVEVLRASLPSDNVWVAQALNHLGLGLQGLERYDEAVAAFEEALRLFRETAGPGVDSIASVGENLVDVHAAAGDFTAAREALEELRGWALAHAPEHDFSGVEARLAASASASKTAAGR